MDKEGVVKHLGKAESNIRKRYSKPFDYFRLGKTAAEGLSFMEHMKNSALSLYQEAEKRGALEKVESCPVCGQSNPNVLFEFLKFPYAQCADYSCSHVFISRPVKDSFRSEFFADDNVYSKKNYCDMERTKFRIEQIAAPKIEHVFSHLDTSKEGIWLDVGCGSGEILAVLRDKNWQSCGLELSKEDCKFGNQVLKVDVRNQTLESFTETYQGPLFDVVSFYGILHCVRKPGDLVKKAAQILKPGGLLVAEVTHFNSMMTESVKSFPDHATRSSYNGVTTLHMFTQQSMQKIFQDSGLEAQSVWFLGADIFEILNQWYLSEPRFAGSSLYQKLLKLANEMQKTIDQAELSESMIWVAKKPKFHGKN